MKISEIIAETTAGAVATVAVPLGGMRKRPNPSVFPKKKNNEDATAKQEDDFHKKLDKLVHKTFGHSSDEKKKKKKTERKLSKSEIKTRDDYADSMSDADFKKRYGDDWEAVKYATATKLAKKK